MTQTLSDRLTAQELRVALAVAHGSTNKAVARELGVSAGRGRAGQAERSDRCDADDDRFDLHVDTSMAQVVRIVTAPSTQRYRGFP